MMSIMFSAYDFRYVNPRHLLLFILQSLNTYPAINLRNTHTRWYRRLKRSKISEDLFNLINTTVQMCAEKLTMTNVKYITNYKSNLYEISFAFSSS